MEVARDRHNGLIEMNWNGYEVASGNFNLVGQSESH